MNKNLRYARAVMLTGVMLNASALEMNAQRVKHLPCIILLDQSEKNGEKGALTHLFMQSIQGEFAPIILSVSLAENVIQLQKKNEIDSNASQNNNQSPWEIYDVPDSPYLLFLPKNLEKKYAEKGISMRDFEQSFRLDQLVRLEDESIVDFISKKSKTYYTFSIENFTKIFQRKNLETGQVEFIWDIIVVGHGTQDRIANMRAKEINSLLNFFDNEIISGVVMIESCYAGGKNLNLLEFKESGAQIYHNFILIVASITDQPINASERNWSEFFLNAAGVSGHGESLNRLLKTLYALPAYASGDPLLHNTAKIPQIWLPGGLGFQTFNIDKEVLVIGKVLVKKYEEDKKPLLIKDKKALLLYPAIIPLEIRLQPTYFAHAQDQLKVSERFPLAQDILKTNAKLYSKLKEEGHVVDFFTSSALEKHALDEANPLLYAYPEFISMIRSDAVHYFQTIHLDSTNSGAQGGVMQFLRDSFLEEHERESKKTFLIDTLIGPNDISLLMAALRLGYGKTQKSLLELAADYAGKTVTLRNVLISVGRDSGSTIQFEIGNFLYSYNRFGLGYWNFTQKDLESSEAKGYRQKRQALLGENYKDLLDEVPQGVPPFSITELLDRMRKKLREQNTDERRPISSEAQPEEN